METGLLKKSLGQKSGERVSFPMLTRLLTVSLASSLAVADPIINEIHYNNDDNTVLNEFLELHNPGPSAIDLGNWEIDGGIRFTFPADATIPAGGYLVIGEDPATLEANYGINALGPYEGALNSRGELIQLLDASGAERDRVDYGVGFPWPTRAKGEGSSMELINPGLDNDLGGSWRSSQIGYSGAKQVYLERGSVWHYRKGNSEASSPIHDWTKPDFVEDASWLTGTAPFGMREPEFTETALFDAWRRYSTVFLRKTFDLEGPPPSSTILRLLYDDGVIVWLNGTEIFRSPSVAPGVIDYRGNDPDNAGGDGTAIGNHEQEGYEEFLLGGTATLFQEGENVLAVQLFNSSAGSSDLLIDAVLESPDPFSEPAPPSPGRINSSSSVVAPPQVRQVTHSPARPTSSDPVTISAKVTDPEGVAGVVVSYQVVEPGAYIRLDDEEYERGWSHLSMSDPDGDDTYTVTLPAQEHRHLIRYRITTADHEDVPMVVPYDDDGQPNFAYFVYDGIPAWSGASRPATDDPQDFPADLLDDLPIYHLIADAGDVTNCQYNSSFQNRRFLGTFVYDGIVYDHIEYKIRGEFSTYRSGKNKWRLFFNPARELEARDNYGEKYPEPWDELNINANASPWAAVNRGMAGLDEALSYKAYQIAGVASPNTNYFHFRVIDEALESSSTDQYRGDLWGLYLAVEQPDGSFLDERDLPPGNVYKIESGGSGDKKHQAPNQPTNSSDWSTFYNESRSLHTESWWRDNLDVETYVTFRAVNRMVGNVDLRYGANHYFYHRGLADGTPDRWVVIPWDLDMMLISMGHWSGTIRQETCLNHPAIRLEYRNRCREILDLMLSDSSPTGGQVGQLVEEFAKFVSPDNQNPTWAELDRNLWNWHPRTQTGNAQTNHRGSFYRTPYGDSRQGGSWTRTLSSPDFDGSRDYVLGYMTDIDPDPSTWSRNSGDQRGYGYNFVSSEARDSAIPDTPVITYTGDPAYATSGLRFESSAFSDPQGAGSFDAMEWRIAEIAAPVGQPPVYELEAGWESGVMTTFTENLTPPAQATRPDRTYRARVRHRDETGRWSHWSDPVEFRTTLPDIQELQDNLVISEIMYNPDGDDAVEFVELFNRGSSPLDLSDVRFTKGIDYDFPNGSTLSPGSHVLVVKNAAAFTARYGNDLPVAAGEYGDDSLSNGGELLKLSLGTVAIHEFVFDDDLPWPTPADAGGYSLVLAHTGGTGNDPVLDPLGHGLAQNWRPSAALGGSPGVSDPTEPLTGDPLADADGDGFNTLLEYTLGTPADVANESPFIVTVFPGQASLTFPVNPLADEVTYRVETSTDLETWVENGRLTAYAPGSRTHTVDVPDGEVYFRLRVQRTEAIPR